MHMKYEDLHVGSFIARLRIFVLLDAPYCVDVSVFLTVAGFFDPLLICIHSFSFFEFFFNVLIFTSWG